MNVERTVIVEVIVRVVVIAEELVRVVLTTVSMVDVETVVEVDVVLLLVSAVIVVV